MGNGWQAFGHRLLRELSELPVGASLLVSEPDPEPSPAPARKWWQFTANRPRAVPGCYLQFQRWEEVVRAECVSGAYRVVSESAHAELMALGWSDPATQPARWGTDNYVYDADPDELEPLADLCVQSLELIGAKADAAWTWRVTGSA
ncbi:MAG: hypothetical protein QM638_10540 [Nocardioides sp.]|uniref:TY-Chap domain-containing protein n=1 Tax=Nocardioides sp. TaxID=35761 RepID=UPI0039E64BEC